MRVLIGDDEVLVRAGLAHVLAGGGFDVVAAAANATELLQLATSHRPDLVVTDIRMPPRNADDGLLAALRIRRELPGTAVVVLSQHLQRRYAVELLAKSPAGVGYLLKQRISDATTFCDDLRRVGAGGTALDPEIVELMLARARRAAKVTGGGNAIDALTNRQRQVLELMAAGYTNAAIARQLSVTEKSVVAHASHIYEGLGLLPDDDGHRRVLAVVQYLNR
ncbi:MAG: response regulator transcription factor [Nakamurella sp.]